MTNSAPFMSALQRRLAAPLAHNMIPDNTAMCTRRVIECFNIAGSRMTAKREIDAGLQITSWQQNEASRTARMAMKSVNSFRFSKTHIGALAFILVLILAACESAETGSIVLSKFSPALGADSTYVEGCIIAVVARVSRNIDSSPVAGETVNYCIRFNGVMTAEGSVVSDTSGLAPFRFERPIDPTYRKVSLTAVAALSNNQTTRLIWNLSMVGSPAMAAGYDELQATLDDIAAKQNRIFSTYEGLARSDRDKREMQMYILHSAVDYSDLPIARKLLRIIVDTSIPYSYREASIGAMANLDVESMRSLESTALSAFIADTLGRELSPLLKHPGLGEATAAVLFWFADDTMARGTYKNAWISGRTVARLPEGASGQGDARLLDLYLGGLSSPREERRLQSASYLANLGQKDKRIVAVLRGDMRRARQRYRLDGSPASGSRETKIGEIIQVLGTIGTIEAANVIAEVFNDSIYAPTPLMQSVRIEAVDVLESLGQQDMVPKKWNLLGDDERRGVLVIPNRPKDKHGFRMSNIRW